MQAALTDPARTYHYDLEIKEILTSGDLAVVRLVWTVKVRPKGGGPEQTTRERVSQGFVAGWKLDRRRAALGGEMCKSSQKWSVRRSAVRSIAWLDSLPVTRQFS